MRNPRRLIKIPTGAYVLFLLLLYNLYRALLPINELCEELLEEEAETQQDIRKFILFTGLIQDMKNGSLRKKATPKISFFEIDHFEKELLRKLATLVHEFDFLVTHFPK